LRRRLVPAFLLLALALTIAACGSSESDEDKIVDVVETSATSTDPADCKALLTVSFLEQVEGAKGQEAVKGCEEDAEDEEGNPDSVDVSKIEVDGSDATADVAFVGGDLDGQKVNIALVEEDGDWKLDQIERFVDFDADSLLGALREGFEEGEGEELELGECLVESLEEASDSELEELVLGGEPEALLTPLVEECQ
jgi:hypothetical protein